MPAGDGSEHLDDRVEPGARGGRVLQQLKRDVVRDSCWAAIPEPITSAARNAEPSSSASRRRGSGARGQVSISIFGASAATTGSLKIDNHHFNRYLCIDGR